MKVKIFLAVIFLVCVIAGCYYDVVKPEDPNKPPQNVSFSGDLQPIFDASCTASGCHDPGSHQPTLTPEDSYSSLTSGGFVNTTIPTESILYKELASGAMPTTGKLPSSQIQMVLDWIKIGAPNN
jgi:hypothetical protein